MNYLYEIFLLLPLINFFAIFLKKDGQEIDMRFSFGSSKLLSLVFLAFLIGISTRDSSKIHSLLVFNEYLSLQFHFDKSSILIAFAMSISWISLIFYIEKLHEDGGCEHDISSFLKYLPLSIWAVNMLNFSLNIYCAVFAYSISILLFAIILLQNLPKKGRKIISFYTTFFLSKILILFVILAIAGKYSIVPNMYDTLYPLEQSSKKVSFLIFALLTIVLLANFVIPIFYIFRNKDISQNFNILPGFFISFCLAQLLFLKFIAQKFFGVGIFSDFLASYFISVIQIVFICSIIASLALLITIKDFSRIFFLTLYNQISLNSLLIFIDFIQDGKISVSLIFTFIIFTTLLFMTLNNLMIYMKEMNKSDLSRSFGHLKINIIILGFCFLSLASLFPPMMLNSIDAILLTKELSFNTTNVVIIVNSIVLLFIGLKIIFPSFQDSQKKGKDAKNQEEIAREVAKKIDFSSELTLTPAVIMFIMVISSFLI